jgi:hypothetical protein
MVKTFVPLRIVRHMTKEGPRFVLNERGFMFCHVGKAMAIKEIIYGTN